MEKKSDKKNVSGEKSGGGFSKVCSLSPQLQKFTGKAELARTEVVKKLWNYIRENNLQDLALAKHIWPLDSYGAKKKRQKHEEDEDSDEPKRKEKQHNSEILSPFQLSDALVKFLGTGETELPRSNVVK